MQLQKLANSLRAIMNTWQNFEPGHKISEYIEQHCKISCLFLTKGYITQSYRFWWCLFKTNNSFSANG